MIIARKMLAPTLVIFFLLLVGMGTFFFIDYTRSVSTQAQHDLDVLQQAVQTDLQSRSALASALAASVSNNPNVQAALAVNDRQRLLDLNLPIFRSISGAYEFSTQQFIIRPATVFLRLEQPGRHDDDLSQQRPGLLKASKENSAATGIEIGPDGVSMRGITPIFFQGRPVGTSEVGIRLGQNLVDNLKIKFGGEWHLLLVNQALKDGGANRLVSEAQSRPTPLQDLSLQATTMSKPVFAPETAYRQALAGESMISSVQVPVPAEASATGLPGEKSYAVRSVPLRDLNGKVIGVIDIWTDQSQAINGLNSRLFLGIGLAAIGMLLGAIILVWSTRRILAPIQTLNAAAAAVAQGELSRRTPQPAPARGVLRRLTPHDEVEQLTVSFNQMAGQIETLVTDLEAQVAARTQQLERRSQQLQAAGDVAAAVASAAAASASSAQRIESLLSDAVEMICERFHFYYAAIYLVDERGEYAYLKAATGQVGEQLLQQNYRLRIGQVGMIGAAAASGRVRVAMEVDKDSLFHYNPLLPETRSEAVLPMHLGIATIGVLDVQSQNADAFLGDDITLLQTMADQLAIAISNTRLIQELNASVADLEQAHGEMARQAWQDHRQRKLNGQAAVVGYIASGERVAPLAAPLSDGGQTAGEALQTTPIQVRGQTIGTVNVRFEQDQPSEYSAGLVEEVAGRLGLVLESARLLYEAQRLAAREQQINWIATQIRSNTSLDVILQNTARSLGQALNASRTIIQVGGAATPAELTASGPAPAGAPTGEHPAQPSLASGNGQAPGADNAAPESTAASSQEANTP